MLALAGDMKGSNIPHSLLRNFEWSASTLFDELAVWVRNRTDTVNAVVVQNQHYQLKVGSRSILALSGPFDQVVVHSWDPEVILIYRGVCCCHEMCNRLQINLNLDVMPYHAVTTLLSLGAVNHCK